MYRLLFRIVILLGVVAWLGLIGRFALLWQTSQQQLTQQATTVSVLPTATPLPLPTIVPATPEPLPDVVGQGGSEPSNVLSRTIAIHPKTGRYIAAWLPTSFDADDARASFEANKDILDEISPFWYGVRADGRLIADTGSRDADLVQIAHDNNVLIIPTIHNIGNAEAASTVVATPENRANHIAIIMDEVRTYNYDGIDIDYEELSADMEDEFSAFMTDLGAALHAEGKLLTVAVHARDHRVGFQNYEDLGRAVDRLRIMTYDYSWRGSGPGPISPQYWVQSVAEYAASIVDPAKIQIGVPFYAYDWGDSDLARAYTWTDVQAIIDQYQPRVNFVVQDSRGLVQERNFYYAGREVWYPDSSALGAKLDLVRDMDLGGIAIWRLGNEDPDNWRVIRDSLQQDPVIIQRLITGYIPEH